MTVSSLPRIIRITDTHDAGEFGAATCPHCGAEGRYVTYFDARDEAGKVVKMGAMAGCFKLFPKSKLVEINKGLIDKMRRYERQGWELNKSDARILDIIDACARGEITEEKATEWVLAERASMAAWRKNRRR